MELPLKLPQRLLGLFLVFLLGSISHAASGDVDLLDLNVVGTVGSTAIQPDGKILLAGNFSSVLGVARNRIARLNADGTLDMGFTPNINSYIYCMAVQADGKILLGGTFIGVDGIPRDRIIRVSSDGVLDESFNLDAGGNVLSLALQPDGKILLAGAFTTISGFTRNYIARVTANGRLDTAFNPGASGNVYSLAVQTDGKILFGGNFVSVGDTEQKFIARVDVNGTLDRGFNPILSGYVKSIVVQGDGKILLAGSYNRQAAIVRVAANGTLDAGFSPDVNSWIDSVALQADGKILLAGNFTSIGGTTRNYIARIASDGSLDEGFDANVNSRVYWSGVRADGRILLVGNFSSVDEVPRNGFAQLLNDPATQTLSVVDSTQVRWTRGGSAPEISQAAFELSTNGGVSYSPLVGTATRAGSTAHWKLAGLNLPASGWLRARGRISGDSKNGSLVEQIVSFIELEPPAATVTQAMPDMGTTGGGTIVTIKGTNFTGATAVTFDGLAASFTVDSATQITAITPPHAAEPVDVRITTPAGSGVGSFLFTYVEPPTINASTARLPNNTNLLTISGNGFSTKPGNNNTVVFLPTGTGTVTAASETSLTVTGISGLSLGALYAVVKSDGLSSAATQVATAVVPGPGDVSPLNVNVIGDTVNTFAVQPDGKTIIMGKFTSVMGQPRNNIARINADGTLDAGFDPKVNGFIYCVALQTDGQILLGGDFSEVGGTLRNNLARVAADGTLDVGFNPKLSGIVSCLAVQGDGKILLGGSSIARLEANGTLDPGFAPNPNGGVNCIAVQTDGEILIGGRFSSIGGITRNRIARLNANGTLATRFNANVNPYVLSYIPSYVSGILVLADSRILFVGDFTSVGGIGRNRVARVDANGTLDLGFNPDPNGTVSSMAVQADGQILFGGSFTSLGLSTRNRIARVAADGTLDEGFNPNANSSVASVAVQTDGQILLGGTFTTMGSLDRSLFSSVINAASTQTLRAVDHTEVLWSRGGSGPEITQALFELSTDRGKSYTRLGTATRVGGSANWQISGLNLPFNGHLRARGITTGGQSNGSSGLVEQVIRFNVLLPDTAMPQTIAFTPPSKLFLSESPLILDASSSSELPVTFAVVSGSASVSRNVLTLTGPGTVKVRASQPGDIGFLAAVPVERTITVAANPTTLTLANLSQTYNGTPRPISVLGTAEQTDVTYKVGSNFVSTAPINVGSYAVKAVAGAITKTGSLVITRAPLFVHPYDQRKFAGQANPALGFDYSGFVGRDNAANSVSKAPAISTTATAASAGGLYPITTNGGSSTNYLFIHQKGTMKVETFAASYEALLLYEGSLHPTAKLELTVAASSKTFTGKFTSTTETAAVSLTGTLTTNPANETATGSATVKKGTNTYLVEFTLPLKGDFAAEVKQNAISLGKTTKGKRLLSLTKGQTLSYIGTHSALLAPATIIADVPAGAGWAVATIDAKGLLKLTGKLADGAGLTASLAADDSSNPGYRLFLQPYTPARTGTFLAGDFALKEHPDHIGRRFVAFEDVADLTWVKAPRLQDSSYRAGFGFVDTRFTLDPWLPPVPAKGIVPAITLAQRLGLNGPANQFTVQHSSISSASFGDLPTTLNLNATTNAVNVSAPITMPGNAAKWKVTLTPTTGAFVGSFELLDGSKRRIVPFAGMMRQPRIGDPNGLIGNGNFLLPSLSPAPNNEVLSGEVGFEK